jgi:N-acetylglucosamine malate deacetylase 2
LHMHLAAANEQITKLIRRTRPEAILTLAYEGGHPDHDCCSILAAHLAVEHGVPLWEFPLYHRAASGEIAYQRFIISAPSDGVALEVTSEELAKKQTMLKAYGSQHPFLFDFDPKVERFRPQHACDYTCPPHAGKLNYEAWGWPISGHDVCAAYAELVATHSAVKR